MKSKIYDEKTKLTYQLAADGCYYPILKAPQAYPLGKYGRLRKSYLMKHRPVIFNHMLFHETLNEHLYQIDQEANQRMEQLIAAFAKSAGTDNALKCRDQMGWVGMMNNHYASAEEVVFAELIYV